jgi:hypothetical protein
LTSKLTLTDGLRDHLNVPYQESTFLKVPKQESTWHQSRLFGKFKDLSKGVFIINPLQFQLMLPTIVRRSWTFLISVVCAFAFCFYYLIRLLRLLFCFMNQSCELLDWIVVFLFHWFLKSVLEVVSCFIQGYWAVISKALSWAVTVIILFYISILLLFIVFPRWDTLLFFSVTSHCYSFVS